MPVAIVKTLYTFVFIIKTIGYLWSSLRPSTLHVHLQDHWVPVVIVKTLYTLCSSSRPLCQCKVIKTLNKASIIKTTIVVVVLTHMVVVIVKDPHLE